MADEDHNPFAAPQSQNVPESPSGQIDYNTLRKTGYGLRLIYFSFLPMAFLVVAICGPAFVAHANWLFSLIAGSSIVLISILTLFGSLMCTTVPPASGGKRLIIGSTFLQALNIPMVFAGAFRGISVIFVLALGISTSLFLFQLFLRRLSAHLGRDDLAGRASRVMIGMAITVLTGIIVAVVSNNTTHLGLQGSSQEFAFAAATVVIVTVVLAVVTYLKNLQLIGRLSKAILKP